MRAIKSGRLVVLSLLLSLTAFLVSGPSERAAVFSGKKPLNHEFSQLGPWLGVREFPMDAGVVAALDLDDFLFRSYRRERAEVNLYIGYYRSAKKVGAAHDPLVCFQGQGWRIDRRDSGSYALRRTPGLAISYASLFAERQEEREVVVYWFQANGRANASTQSQKFTMVLDRIAGKGEANAFVRLSTPVGGDPPEAARARIFDFIEEFYPEFLRYVTSS